MPDLLPLFMKGTLILLALLLLSCQPEVPHLDGYHLSDPELQIEIVASEPDIIAPIAIDFDQNGRMWVAEMPDYMPDINGEKEAIPAGRIIIMEDLDGDGKMDQSKIFLKDIHQLRAIRLFRNGLLYADDPNLYFTEIINDQPRNTILIDSTYALGGNIEHKANGLLKGIDQCFYSAKSHHRYCYNGGSWKKEAVFFRGQWGITQDENGRLYANDNSNLLFGDYFLPSMLTHNKYIHKEEGINTNLVESRQVFPIQATAINRGYSEGTLDENGYLKNVTSSCGPHIYRDRKIGASYYGDAFVCVPEANLIKQLEVKQNDLVPSGRFALEEEEFLVSEDPAFRPVNIETGPDGDLYIVDFHRGIIQHKIYMTNYLREKILGAGLDQVVNYGRVLKVSRKGSRKHQANFDFTNVDSLLKYISTSMNPWLLRMAQEELSFSTQAGLKEELYQVLAKGNKNAQLYGLWTLHERGEIELDRLLKIEFTDPWVIANLFKIISSTDAVFDETLLAELFTYYKFNESSIVQNHLAAALHILYPVDKEVHQKILSDFDTIYNGPRLSAYPSGVKVAEQGSVASTYNRRVEEDQIYYIHDKRRKVAEDEGGYALYNTYCSSCHGWGGNGVEGQAPSLIDANLVNGSKEIIPLIIMHGLKGKVTINGQEEAYGAVMPAFAKSANLDNNEITQISNYIYNAFRNQHVSIDEDFVVDLESKFRERKEMWTESELLDAK